MELGRRTAVMAVINVTPDSFLPGSRRLDAGEAVETGLAMVDAGADIIDIGGESTRPGAHPVPVAEELRRVGPVIAGLRRHTDAWISVDTRRPAVAREALDLGADIVNDVSGLQGGPAIARQVARAEAGLVLMHMKGTPRTMQRHPTYEDVISEITEFLKGAIERAENAGVCTDSLVVDPGIGFGKTSEHNLQILNRIGLLGSLGKPVLVGTSRKSFIGNILDLPPESRMMGTAATVAAAILRGAHLVRVHDAAEMVQVARVADAICNEKIRTPPPPRAVEARG